MLGRLFRLPAPPRAGPVGVFFDIENCTPPRWVSAAKLVLTLRALTRPWGPLSFIRIYQDSKSAMNNRLMTGFLEKASRAGIEIRDCPHNGEKEVSDRHIMADMAAFALDNPAPATLVLMTSDHDFSPILNMLRNRHYRIILIEGQRLSKPALRVASDLVYGFEDVMGRSHLLSADEQRSVDPQSQGNLARSVRRLLSSSAPNLPPSPPPALPTTEQTVAHTQHVPSNYLAGLTDQTLYHPLVSALTLSEFRRPFVPQLAVSRAILQRDPAAYARAGCRTYNEYFLQAQARGLVCLGVGGENMWEWMTLSPSLQALVSDFAYDEVPAAPDGSGSMPAVCPASVAARRLATAGQQHTSAHQKARDQRATVPLVPKAYYRWEKERRKKLMRAATAAVARGSRLGSRRGGGLTRVLSADGQPDTVPLEEDAKTSLNETATPAGVTAAEDLERGSASSTHQSQPLYDSTSPPSTLPHRSPAPTSPIARPRTPASYLPSFTRNPPLTPLPAHLFAPLLQQLDRPHLQNTVLLALSRTGEADSALQAVGAADWTEYVQLAEVSGVVELGKDGRGRERWISLPRSASTSAEPAADLVPVFPPSPSNGHSRDRFPTDQPATFASDGQSIGFGTPSSGQQQPDSPV